MSHEIISVRMQRKVDGHLASIEYVVDRSFLDVPSAGTVLLDMLDRGFAAGLDKARGTETDGDTGSDVGATDDRPMIWTMDDGTPPVAK